MWFWKSYFLMCNERPQIVPLRLTFVLRCDGQTSSVRPCYCFPPSLLAPPGSWLSADRVSCCRGAPDLRRCIIEVTTPDLTFNKTPVSQRVSPRIETTFPHPSEESQLIRVFLEQTGALQVDVDLYLFSAFNWTNEWHSWWWA